MRRVIVNSTPLIVLCGIGQLELLRKLYGEIHIPLAVYKEVTAKTDSACIQIKKSRNWVHVDTIKDLSEKKMYRAKLHDGEVEVMILAQEQKADLLIIDDNAAKKTAKYLGLTVTGTLGVLLKARKEGFIQEIRPLLSEMKRNGFYISNGVEKLVLESAGEDKR
ncbi:MAG: DUF3368 domain-containing protein [Clostridiales bacterium]|nr:DUF3368 domain-containing protein [Clostridiales bacterium]